MEDEEIAYLMEMGFQRRESALAAELLQKGQGTHDADVLQEASDVLNQSALEHYPASPMAREAPPDPVSDAVYPDEALAMLLVVCDDLAELEKLREVNNAAIAASTTALREAPRWHTQWMEHERKTIVAYADDVEDLVTLPRLALAKAVPYGASSGGMAAAIGPCPTSVAQDIAGRYRVYS